MNNKAQLKYMHRSELFKAVDAIKILAVYFNIGVLEKLRAEIKKELEERAKE